ncbi:DUF748 domain-containing protein [Pseudodesulfovibrio sp.]|uniref:DUF748 domain-containing protein n=1 Tax=unclassified Pseudodesulfovibrio TaxID=2661612 RepID=UPI003AFF7A75
MLAFLDKISYGTPLIRRILFWLLSIFIVYVLVGFLVVPPVLKTVITDQCQSALNRKGTVERVAFNPLTLRLEADGIAVAKRQGEGNILSVDKIEATAGLSSIWRLAPVITELKLVNPSLDITFFGNGKYSFSDLIGARDETKKSPEKKEESTAVFPFALYGFEMSNATIVFDDRPHEKRHVISSMNLVVPFTSSFSSLRKEYTQPKFTAEVNGDPIEITGRTLPFDNTLRTEFKLGAVNVDLHQYWAYLPIETPLILESGRFTSDISLFFERPDAQRLNLLLGGGGSLADLKLKDSKEGTVLSLDKVSFQMNEYSLGDNHLSIKNVSLEHPYCKLIRTVGDEINWAAYFPAPKEEPSAAENATRTNDPGTGGDFTMDIQNLTMANGDLDWQDRAVAGGFKRVFKGLTVNCEHISTRDGEVSAFKGTLGKQEQFGITGSLALAPSLDGNATLTGKNISLPMLKPYYAEALPMELDSGNANFSVTVVLRPEAGATDVDVVAGTASLTNLALRKPDAKEPSLSLAELAVSGTTLDLKGQDLTIREVRLSKPDVKLVREKSGDIDLAQVFANNAEAPAAEAVALENKEDSAEKPKEEEASGWTANIEMVRVTDGSVAFRDLAIANPTTLSVHDLALDMDDITTRSGATMPFRLNARWGKNGGLEAKGKALLDPLKVNGTLKVNALGLRPLDGYLGEFSELLFANGAMNADLAYEYAANAKESTRVTGQVSLTNVQLRDNRGSGEFAGLNLLEVKDIRLTGEPYRLRLGTVSLRDPSISIEINEKGESNFRYALRIPQGEQQSPEQLAAEAKAEENAQPAASPAPEAAKGDTQKKDQAEQPEEDTISIGRVTMTDGKVRFHDASVKPAYTSTLSEMQLSATDLHRAENARPKFDFKGKFGPTPITIIGTCNPLISPPHFNLAISVSGMEMVPLTPYTLAYLAYPVEKGRLYADVKFKTDAWELTAENKFFVEQLVLGSKDKRPNAPNVPVQFGLSLLQDSKGDIQINLPIRGRLDDPDFRIGPIVFKAIINLFFKALTSPFSLIGSIFGGGSGGNMDFVVFDPGYSTLGIQAKSKLDTIIKALTERTKLKLEVDGVVDPDTDRKGLMKAIFEHKIRQQKYDDLSRKERAATTVDQVRVLPDEYKEYLFDAYKEEDDPEDVRPTTLFVVDEQPIDVMEKFIMDRIHVTDADLEELSVARAKAVKGYIIDKAPELTERVFLLDRKKDRRGKTGVPLHRADLGIK